MKKRLTYIFLAVAIVCLSVIPFFNFKNQTIAKASGESHKELNAKYIYVLPAVNITYSPTGDTTGNYQGVIPSVFVLFNDDLTLNSIYTMTGGSRNNFYWWPRYFEQYGGNNTYRSIQPFGLVAQYTIQSSAIGGQINWSAENYATIIYKMPDSDELYFTYGEFECSSASLSTNSYIEYRMVGNSNASFSLLLNFNSGITALNYTATFSPTTMVTSNVGGDYVNGYDEGYLNGYTNGQQYGEVIGYERGINDANVYSFGNLFSAVIDAPINSFKALLNFDLLGINLLDFSLAILTFFLIIKIISLITGG